MNDEDARQLGQVVEVVPRSYAATGKVRACVGGGIQNTDADRDSACSERGRRVAEPDERAGNVGPSAGRTSESDAAPARTCRTGRSSRCSGVSREAVLGDREQFAAGSELIPAETPKHATPPPRRAVPQSPQSARPSAFLGRALPAAAALVLSRERDCCPELHRAGDQLRAILCAPVRARAPSTVVLRLRAPAV